MDLANLSLPIFQHAFAAATIVAVVSGVIGPFVITRRMSFAVHGAAELSLTGAAAGLLIAGSAVGGALVGSLVVATAFSLLALRDRERDSAIGVVLAVGLGLGFYLLEFYQGFTSEAVDILIGQITAVSVDQVALLGAVAAGVLVVMAVIWRPLTFASIDPDVAQARGVRTRLVGLVFLYVLAVTVTEAAQIVGTLLVLSLVITPAAAAQRFTARAWLVVALSVVFALVAADGGLFVAVVYVPSFRASSFITFIAFGIYVVARAYAVLSRRRASSARPLAAPEPAGVG